MDAALAKELARDESERETVVAVDSAANTYSLLAVRLLTCFLAFHNGAVMGVSQELVQFPWVAVATSETFSRRCVTSNCKQADAVDGSEHSRYEVSSRA